MKADGSGIDPRNGINETNIPFVIAEIAKFLRPGGKILDVGAGVGTFQWWCDTYDIDYDVRSVEGAVELEEHSLVAPARKMTYFDATAYSPPEWSNAFDLVTHFEVAEHIPERLQEQFWANLFEWAPRVFCSICIAGESLPESQGGHICVRNEDWWDKFFERTGRTGKFCVEPVIPELPFRGDVRKWYEEQHVWLLVS
jgi:hypothetical protein